MKNCTPEKIRKTARPRKVNRNIARDHCNTSIKKNKQKETCLFILETCTVYNMCDSRVCCYFPLEVRFAPDWRRLLQWKWDFWRQESEIQSLRMSLCEEDCCASTLWLMNIIEQSGIKRSNFQEQNKKQGTQMWKLMWIRNLNLRNASLPLP